MAHSKKHARRWLQLVMQQSLPSGEVFASHVTAGEITSLCTCGCHGFTFEIPDEAQLQPLTKGAGLCCELVFESDAGDEIDILLFTDSRGFFSGTDVTLGSCNVKPMPDSVTVHSLIGVWPSENLFKA